MADLDERLHALLAAARVIAKPSRFGPANAAERDAVLARDFQSWRAFCDAVEALADIEPCTCAAIRSGFDPAPIPPGHHHVDCPVTNNHPELAADAE